MRQSLADLIEAEDAIDDHLQLLLIDQRSEQLELRTARVHEIISV